MSGSLWKQHFGNIVTGYDPVDAQGLSELGYAIKHNQISQQTYLEWARSTYENCSLDVKFFQEQAPLPALFQRLKDVYPWSPECMPIAEWDDHVIVAGLEKPHDLPPEYKCIFLIAPLQGLQIYWDAYNVETSSTTEGEEVIEIQEGGLPDGLAPEIGEFSNTGLSFAGITLANRPIETSESSTPPVATASKSVPPKASQNSNSKPLSQPTKPLPAVSQKIAVETNPNAKLPPKSNSESSGNLETATAKVKAALQNQAAAVAKPKVPPPQSPPPQTIPLSVPSDEISHVVGKSMVSESTASVAVKNLNPETVNTSADTLISEDDPADEISVASTYEASEIKAQPKIVAVPSSNFKIDEAAVLDALDQFRNHYDKRAYIEFNPAARTAISRYWPQDFVATQNPTPHTLDRDSFLSIVNKTQKPYHGHVIKNTISESFFREMNQGEIPENLTLVPIVKGEEVIGALAGWGPKTTYNLTVLRDIQKVATDLILRLGWAPPEAA